MPVTQAGEVRTLYSQVLPQTSGTSEHPGRGRPRTALYVLLSDLSQEMQTLPSHSEGIRVHAVWEWKLTV